MNCREFETHLVLRLLEPLMPAAQAELDAHRAVCQRCAVRYEKASRLPVFMPVQAGPDAAEPLSSKAEVFARLEEARAPRPRPARPRFVWAAAGALAFLLAGIAIGVTVLRPGRPGPERSALSPDNVFKAYVDRLEPVLVGFQMKGSELPPADLAAFEKRMTAELRADTAALEEAARLAGQSDLVEILDEIDTLLLNIARLQAGDEDAAGQLRRLIRDNRQAWSSRLLSFGTTL
jgi:hypothetical protein